MANMNNTRKQIIFPDENVPILHRKKSVNAASVKTKGSVLGHKKPGGGGRKALNDITNKSEVHPKASEKNKQIVKDELNIAGEMFLHDHSKCIKEQQNQNLWDDLFSSEPILLHHDSSIKEKHIKYDTEKMDAKNSLTYDEPQEISSPELTPWRSPIRSGSIIPSTPLAWQFESPEFKLKED